MIRVYVKVPLEFMCVIFLDRCWVIIIITIIIIIICEFFTLALAISLSYMS